MPQYHKRGRPKIHKRGRREGVFPAPDLSDNHVTKHPVSAQNIPRKRHSGTRIDTLEALKNKTLKHAF